MREEREEREEGGTYSDIKTHKSRYTPNVERRIRNLYNILKTDIAVKRVFSSDQLEDEETIDDKQ